MGKRWDRGDYCDIIPDILFGVDLSKCCYQHDLYYWKKPITRKAADLRLKRCVLEKYKFAGKYKLGKFVSKLIYYFLRVFGWIRWDPLKGGVNMAKQKIKIISAGKLDKSGFKKLGKSFVISLAAAGIAFVGDLTNVVDFGGYENIALTFIPFAVNFLRKWLTTYESK